MFARAGAAQRMTSEARPVRLTQFALQTPARGVPFWAQGQFPQEGELPMTMEDRVDSLKARHARLEEEISDEAHRPLPDQVHITELKKQKLRIKEEMSRMAH
jgi:hypothetical protein